MGAARGFLIGMRLLNCDKSDMADFFFFLPQVLTCNLFTRGGFLSFFTVMVEPCRSHGLVSVLVLTPRNLITASLRPHPLSNSVHAHQPQLDRFHGTVVVFVCLVYSNFCLRLLGRLLVNFSSTGVRKKTPGKVCK